MTDTLQELPELPLPPPEMRRLVCSDDPGLFDNPSRELVFPHLSPEVYDAVAREQLPCVVVMAPSRPGVEEAPFPADEVPTGSSPPLPMPADAERIGLDG